MSTNVEFSQDFSQPDLLEIQHNEFGEDEGKLMDTIFNPKFRKVGEMSLSGTCASVSQNVAENINLHGRPTSKLCMQSKIAFNSNLPKVPLCPTIEDIRNSLNSETGLWEDESFPASDTSLYTTATRPPYLPYNIEWKRPTELVSNPQLVTNGLTRFDINQGRLGDCWFIAALSQLTMKEDLLNQVLPSQSFNSEHLGAVTVRFFVCGEWKEVKIDDRIPTLNGRPVFLRSDDPAEFWPSMVEKAFAKLQGSYHGLNGGTYGEASSYFGAITEEFNIRGPKLDGLDPPYVKERLLEADLRGSLCGGAIYDLGHNSMEVGLPPGHAYSLTAFSSTMIRVRNPWGQDTEWVGQQSEPDGEFWMNWEDFMAFFNQVQVSHYTLHSAAGLDPGRGLQWSGRQIRGEWNSTNCGGCPNYATFGYNTQYQITIQAPSSVTLIVALDQFPGSRQAMGMEKHAIGFIIYKSTAGKKLSRKQLTTKPWVADSGVYRFQKQVAGRYSMDPGTYTILPTTYHPGKMASYLLRVFYSN